MTYNHRPEYEAPDELRCEALVRGQPSYNFEWMRRDHRCPRRANQCRAGHVVCYQHATAKEVTWYEKTPPNPKFEALMLTNPEKWELIKKLAAQFGRDPYEMLKEQNTWEVCKRCHILINPQGGHRCDSCGRDV